MGLSGSNFIVSQRASAFFFENIMIMCLGKDVYLSVLSEVWPFHSQKLKMLSLYKFSLITLLIIAFFCQNIY